MKRFLTFPRLGMLFLAIFGLLVGATLIFQKYWVAPGDRCEANGQWYDIETRTCATPLYIPDITGRAEGVTRAQASEEKNKELLRLEGEYAAYQQAIRDQRARDEAALNQAQGKAAPQ